MDKPANRLETFKQWAQIVSAFAVPIVLAVVGYFVQKSLAEAGLRKDYVQMSLGVLREAPSKENKQLRQWAISVLDKNSPVPIPFELKTELILSKSFADFLKNPPEESVECKAVPNRETLEWLLANDPARYVRCPDGKVGERQVLWGAYWNKRPAAPARASSDPRK